MESRTTNLTQNVATRIEADDTKNTSGGPFIFQEGRAFTAASLAASASGAVFSNVSIQWVDNDRTQRLAKQDVLLPTLVSFETNTWKLDRPHVVSPATSFSAVLREENAAGTTDAYLSLLGSTVIPRATGGRGVTAAEVREAVALGIFPSFANELGSWERWTFFSTLLGDDEPVCGSAAGEKLRLRLRERTAELRLRLAEAQYHAHVLTAFAADITQSTATPLPSDRLRNDSGAVFVVSKMRLFTRAALAATAAAAIFNNVSIGLRHMGPDRNIVKSKCLAPLLFSRRDNTYELPHPLVLAPDETLEFDAIEENVNGATDVHVGVHGELIFGMNAEEVREAISLGLYSTWGSM